MLPDHTASPKEPTVTGQLVSVYTTADTSEPSLQLWFAPITRGGKNYLLLLRNEGQFRNEDGFIYILIDTFKAVAVDMRRCHGVEQDRIAINPDLYELLPLGLMDYIEIDEDMLYLNAEGLERWTRKVPLYKIEMH